MKIQMATLAGVCVVALTACGSKTDTTEKSLGEAMDRYLDQKGHLCLNTRLWPVDFSDQDLSFQKDMKFGSARQMAALEAVGLVQSADIHLDTAGTMEPPQGEKTQGSKARSSKSKNAKSKEERPKIKRYTLTERAKPYTQQMAVTSMGAKWQTAITQTDLCWGKKALDRLVKWEGPVQSGGHEEVSILYTYKIHPLADWAQSPKVQAAFPIIQSTLDGVGSKQAKHTLLWTLQGWEAKGLD